MLPLHIQQFVRNDSKDHCTGTDERKGPFKANISYCCLTKRNEMIYSRDITIDLMSKDQLMVIPNSPGACKIHDAYCLTCG